MLRSFLDRSEQVRAIADALALALRDLLNPHAPFGRHDGLPSFPLRDEGLRAGMTCGSEFPGHSGLRNPVLGAIRAKVHDSK